MYMNFIWGFCKKKLMKELEVLQKRTIKSIFGYPWLMPSNELFSKTEILPVQKQAKMSASVFVYKLEKKMIHTQIQFTHVNDIHQYKTRGVKWIFTNHSNSVTFGTKGIMSSVIREFNTLSVDVKESVSLHSFKRKAREYFQLSEKKVICWMYYHSRN